MHTPPYSIKLYERPAGLLFIIIMIVMRKLMCTPEQTKIKSSVSTSSTLSISNYTFSGMLMQCVRSMERVECSDGELGIQLRRLGGHKFQLGTIYFRVGYEIKLMLLDYRASLFRGKLTVEDDCLLSNVVG